MDLEIKDRIAIVTGPSRGIGKAIAFGLARKEVKVTICARNEEELRKTAEEIASSTGTEVLPVGTDVTNKENIRSLVTRTVEKFGRVDISK